MSPKVDPGLYLIASIEEMRRSSQLGITKQKAVAQFEYRFSDKVCFYDTLVEQVKEKTVRALVIRRDTNNRVVQVDVLSKKTDLKNVDFRLYVYKNVPADVGTYLHDSCESVDERIVKRIQEKR